MCRELTKIHEQIVHGTLEELAAAAADGAIPARGEFVLVVGAASDSGSTAVPDADSLRDALAAVEELVTTARRAETPPVGSLPQPASPSETLRTRPVSGIVFA